LDQYEVFATWPVTAAAVRRNKGVIEAIHNRHVEFAVHGYYHVDHSLLTAAKQNRDLSTSRQLFMERQISASGFRSPYLRSNQDTIEAVRKSGYRYDSSQSLSWDVLDGKSTAGYQRALEFYGAQPAGEYPALPRIENGLVEIPYCLPDDEALWDRLQFTDDADRSQPWLDILLETHQRGELFSLGLHPERIYLLEKPLRAVLQRAQDLQPAVWFARLDEIARWWLTRSALHPTITQTPAGSWIVRVEASPEITFQTRGVSLAGPSTHWDGAWSQAVESQIEVNAPIRPWIGLSPETDPALTDFLRQQGFIEEDGCEESAYGVLINCPSSKREDERRILAELEALDRPLIRLGRWPSGAKSALCVTGDIDALTIWDYLMRFVGH